MNEILTYQKDLKLYFDFVKTFKNNKYVENKEKILENLKNRLKIKEVDINI